MNLILNYHSLFFLFIFTFSKNSQNQNHLISLKNSYYCEENIYLINEILLLYISLLLIYNIYSKFFLHHETLFRK